MNLNYIEHSISDENIHNTINILNEELERLDKILLNLSINSAVEEYIKSLQNQINNIDVSFIVH